jgi:hypothetical protein
VREGNVDIDNRLIAIVGDYELRVEYVIPIFFLVHEIHSIEVSKCKGKVYSLPS